MAEFLAGQRVKLTAAAAQVKQRGIIKRNRKKIDWMARVGTVRHRTMPGSGGVLIIWDGMKTADQWPKTAIELING